MLSHIVFDANPGPYRLAILIKGTAMRKEGLEQHYVEPLVQRGFLRSEILALSLEYNQANKAPASLIKSYLETIRKILEQHGIQHILCADASYFKVLCKVRKAEPHYGYVLPSIWSGVQTALTINYTQLFHNPNLKDRLMLGVEAVSRSAKGDVGLFFENPLKNVSYPKSGEEIGRVLDKLLEHPALTCDIETYGLKLSDSQIISIAFAWNRHSGTSFLVRDLNQLKSFFRCYQGKLIFHNAPFDTGRLIYQLFMGRNASNQKGLLRGLEFLYRDTEDTRLLSYLATNTTAGNELSLKKQAFEFAGNWALDEIRNPSDIPTKKLLEYNLTDALATWYVYEKHRETVREEQEQVYQELFRPALKVITQMELQGMPLDMNEVELAKDRLYHDLYNCKDRIMDSPIVKLFESELRVGLALDANQKLKKKVKTAADFEFTNFNPRSTKQLRKLLYDHLELPILRYTDTNLASTDSKTLTALIAHIEKKYDL